MRPDDASQILKSHGCDLEDLLGQPPSTNARTGARPGPQGPDWALSMASASSLPSGAGSTLAHAHAHSRARPAPGLIPGPSGTHGLGLNSLSAPNGLLGDSPSPRTLDGRAALAPSVPTVPPRSLSSRGAGGWAAELVASSGRKSMALEAAGRGPVSSGGTISPSSLGFASPASVGAGPSLLPARSNSSSPAGPLSAHASFKRTYGSQMSTASDFAIAAMEAARASSGPANVDDALLRKIEGALCSGAMRPDAARDLLMKSFGCDLEELIRSELGPDAVRSPPLAASPAAATRSGSSGLSGRG
ncbi:hypothetical protein HYH03_017629 [Edaphochlamys debaryana]|uniref:Uncharacterized protein n=1 Tax=Edaphochlamys debaryana TaxID=47281 RepID=A0A836BP45_9CHLO|nr:hypothetical protein HYH03_017629 [Edaphochlamys debaryana]|eukprot:KAG2483522.1 hypothetical protein HYH03_017629 [Edaphochlamys debaryana]